MALFRAPRHDCPVDLDAHLRRLPEKATCKGMFFRDMFALVADSAHPEELAERAGVTARRYVPFLDYPMSDNLKLTVEVAKVLHPELPVGGAIRRIGRTSYLTFLQSQPARVLLAAIGANEVEKVLLLAPKAYPIVMNFGRVWAEKAGDRCIHSGCADFPAFLETYQVGVVEGIFDHFRVRGQVRIALDNVANAVIEATWEPEDGTQRLPSSPSRTP